MTPDDQESLINQRFKQYRKRTAVAFACLAVGLGFASWELNHVINRVDQSSKNQLSNRVANINTWCTQTNASRDYERLFFNQTAAQTKLQIEQIEKAIHGKTKLTPAQVAYWHNYLQNVIALERDVPQTVHIHPFTLPDLNCKALVQKTANSAK